MLDFPASPTVGQQFTAAGVTWVWDGTKWAASGLTGGPFLPLGGGILTGPVTFPFGSVNAPRIDAASGNSRLLLGTTNASLRWGMVLGDNASEFGSNAGSNFAIAGYSDSGALLGNDLTINRATGVVTIPSLAAPQAMGDNRIINGDMRIDQRNGGALGTAIGYTVDRWQYVATQPNLIEWGRNTGGAPGLPYSIGFVSTSAYTPLANDAFVTLQPIEADMISDFQWGTVNAQPVTLSFWAASSNAGIFSGAVKNYALTRSYPFTFSLPGGNTWTKVAIAIPGDTAGTWVNFGNAGALYTQFDLGSGANFRGPAGVWASANYTGVTGTGSIVSVNGAGFFLTGVKLEIGSVATPFNRQSLAKSMADCQRYFWDPANGGSSYALQIGVNAAVAGGSTGQMISLPVTMRAGPTIVLRNQSYGNASSLSVSAISAHTLASSMIVTAVGNANANFNLTASAEL